MLTVTLKRNGSAAVLLLSGRIDANTADDLEKTLLEQSERFKSITLDFSKVPYISSAGLRTLRKLNRAIRAKDGTLRIRNVRKDVMDIFQVTGFISLLDIDDE